MSLIQTMAVHNGKGAVPPNEYNFDNYWHSLLIGQDWRASKPDEDKLRGLLLDHDRLKRENAEMAHRLAGLDK